MAIRGIRGATLAEKNKADAILSATRELLSEILSANPTLQPGDIASAFFTVSEDLDAAYPALAAREIGWDHVPMLCAREIPVPDGMQSCIRILLHWNTELPQSEIQHVYLGQAANLRPDLAAIDRNGGF